MSLVRADAKGAYPVATHLPLDTAAIGHARRRKARQAEEPGTK